MNSETASRPATSALCAICQTPLGPTENEPTTTCPACDAKYHADCWLQNGGCAVYGCAQVPATEGRASIEIPVGYWGQEHKPCPVCNAQILAAALRCRHCGTVFPTARPLGSAEYSRATSQEAQSPRVRRIVLWLFVLCLIPFSAPIAAVVGFGWVDLAPIQLRACREATVALCRPGKNRRRGRLISDRRHRAAGSGVHTVAFLIWICQ